MGQRISYLACKCSLVDLAACYDLAVVDHSLEISPGDLVDLPDGVAYLISLTNGWTIWCEPYPESFTLHTINPFIAGKIAIPVFAVSVDETRMQSSITRYTRSAKTWGVQHKGNGADRAHLDVIGKPPAYVAQMQAAAAARMANAPAASEHADRDVPEILQTIAENMGATVTVQAGGAVDHMFDVPIQIGEREFGFASARSPKADTVVRLAIMAQHQDTVAEPAPSPEPDPDLKPQKASWLSRLFGRRSG